MRKLIIIFIAALFYGCSGDQVKFSPHGVITSTKALGNSCLCSVQFDKITDSRDLSPEIVFIECPCDVNVGDRVEVVFKNRN
jgi:hypothetical protein